MNRRHPPLVHGLAAAASTSAVGISINIVTDHLGSVLAWAVVGACTFLAGAVTAAVGRTRGAEPPPDPREIVQDRLIIEMTIGPDGPTSVNASADGPYATAKLTQLVTTISSAQPPPAVSPGGAALPKPLPVALVTRSRTTGIARQLQEAGRLRAGSGELDIRLCVDNRATMRRAALWDANVVIIDDHCERVDGAAPLVGGLDLGALRHSNGDGLRAQAIILACHDGAGHEHTKALRRSLDRPAAFLGCAGAVPDNHRALLYPALLDQLRALAGTHADADQLCSVLDDALSLAHAERPLLDWGRWTATVLTPTTGHGRA